jgi:hypothetical protein
MEARMCFEFYHGLADISKFYPMLAMILNICNPYDFPQTPEQDVKVEKLE